MALQLTLIINAGRQFTLLLIVKVHCCRKATCTWDVAPKRRVSSDRLKEKLLKSYGVVAPLGSEGCEEALTPCDDASRAMISIGEMRNTVTDEVSRGMAPRALGGCNAPWVTIS